MRRFLCLILALCLMASLLAIPASATSVTTVTFDGLAAVAAMISGIGVTINAVENFPVFNTLVSSVFDHLTAQNIIDAAGTISALVSGQKTYIPASVVQSVKDWLFDSKTISAPSTGKSFSLNFANTTYTVEITSNTMPVFAGKYYIDKVYVRSEYKTALLLYSTEPFSFIANDISYSGSLTPTGYYFHVLHILQTSNSSYYSDGIRLPYLDTWDWSYYADYMISQNNTITSDSITFGNTAPISSTTIEENYPAWVESAILSPPITLPGGTEDDEAIQYIPVSIPSYSVSTPAVPPAQTDVWTGTYTSPDTGSDPTEEVPVVPDVTGDIASGVTDIASIVKLIADYIRTIKDAVVEWFTVTWAAFVTWLMDTLTAIKDAVVALPGLIVDAITAVGTTVKSIWDWLVDVLGTAIETIVGTLSDLLAWALGLVEALVAALEALLVKIFVPDIASIKAAVADMRAQFPFFDAIIATGQYLVSGISSGEPPIIYIHLENAEGLYTWGNTVAVLDMSFYSRYKPAGDAIMSSALITFFAWRTLKHLPGILSGAASDSDVFKEI